MKQDDGDFETYERMLLEMRDMNLPMTRQSWKPWKKNSSGCLINHFGRVWICMDVYVPKSSFRGWDKWGWFIYCRNVYSVTRISRQLKQNLGESLVWWIPVEGFSRRTC